MEIQGEIPQLCVETPVVLEDSAVTEVSVSPSRSTESEEESRQQRKRKGETELEDEVNRSVPTEDRRITLSTEEFVDALLNHKKTEYSCQDPSCRRTFPSLEEYNDHYVSKHMYKCSVCKRQLPGSHLLELHVLETHDTLFSLMAERKPMYACLAEECPEKFQTTSERYSHFHERHKHHELFPAFRHFQNISQNPSGGQSKKGSKSRNKKSGKSSAMEVVDNEKINNSGVLIAEDGNAMEVQTTVGNKPCSESGKPDENKKSHKNKQTKTDFKFGHHVTPFRPWHASAGVKACKPETTMDLSSFKDVLDTDVTNKTTDSAELQNETTAKSHPIT